MRTKQPAFAAASALVLTILALSTPLFAADANHKPWLCGATISPKSGAARTVYVASVRYCDPDGARPAKVDIEDLMAIIDDGSGAREEASFDRGGEALGPRESAVLALVDGVRTVQDLIDLGRLGEFETCKVLYGLLSLDVFRWITLIGGAGQSKIKPEVVGPPPAGFQIARVIANPAAVKVSGPESVVRSLRTLSTEPISLQSLGLGPQALEKTVEVPLVLSPASLRLLAGQSRKAQVSIQIKPATP